MTETHEIILGDKYTDSITGFNGVAISIAYYLTGCEQVCLIKLVGGDIKEFWFDITRLKVRKDPIRKKVGGPQSTPPSMHS